MKNKLEPKIIRSKRRTLTLHVLPDSTLVVKAPYFMPTFFINKFINDNVQWIEKKLNVLKSKPYSDKKSYKDGERYFFLGKEYMLQIGVYTEIQLKDEKFLFPKAAHFRIQKELTAWYVRQAREIIARQVEFYAERMKVQYTDLVFTDTKSQWGRCTHDNRLQFSWRLVMAPLLVINYVVVHELAHITEKNHSRAFWNKVRFHNPSFRQQIKWLKDNGHSLKI